MHEGPARISKLGTTPLKRGMILSNEPGYYKTDGFGIRIENLELVTAADVAGAEKPMNAFETLTFAPIDRRLIDVTDAEPGGNRLAQCVSRTRCATSCARSSMRPTGSGSMSRPRRCDIRSTPYCHRPRRRAIQYARGSRRSRPTAAAYWIPRPCAGV